MRQGRSLKDLAAEIERRAGAKRDFIARASKLAVEVITPTNIPGAGSGPAYPVLTVHGTDTTHAFPLRDVAHQQLAEFTGVPMAYYRRMLTEAPALLANNVNRWLGGMDNARRMVRTLDGHTRALLSDSYRPLENEDLANAILPVLLESELLVESCEITERRLYIKAIDARITRDVPTGRKMGDGSHVFFDTCSPAIIVSNSEIGQGSLSVETGVYTRACTNMAMFGARMRKYHVGKRADMTQEVFALLTDETKRQTDKAIWMQTRDLVKGAFDQVQFDGLMERLGAAAGDVIPAAQVEDVIELTAKRFSFNEGERKGILARLIEGADLTRYGLHAAITRHSADVEDYDRATELERLGGDVIELPDADWKRLVAVPA